MKNNIKIFFVFFVTILSLLLILNTAISQQTAGQLFEKALYLEEANGELQPAIELYQQILDQYPEDREVAAKSLLHMGMCYEKLGNREAKIVYQEVIQNYGDQKDVVKIAREQLSRLILMTEKVVKTPITPKFMKIKAPTQLSPSVRLSPDGKNLALVYDKKLWLMPLSGNLGPGFPGTPAQVNTEGLEVGWSGLSWSRDGKWIAFNENSQMNDYLGNQGIYIVSSNGGKPKKIVDIYRDARIVNYRMSLSPSGQELTFSSIEESKQHIYRIQVEGVNPIQLTDMEAREPVYSPDGKMIAYVADRGIGRGAGDLGLWVIPTNGGNPQLVAEAGKASSPVWSPDGSMIAYLDYNQEQKIFIARIDKEGNAIGNFISIDAPEGTSEIILLAGWTEDNRIGTLLVKGEESALYTLPVKGGQAAMILHSTNASMPRWSTDGKQIFYTTQYKEVDKKFTWGYLSSVSANGGSGKPLRKNQDGETPRLCVVQGGNRISPDGKMIISSAWTEDISPEFYYPKARIWKLAIDGTESTQITNNTQGPYLDGSPSWSPDGTKVAFVRTQLIMNNSIPGDADIYVIDSSGGEPQLLASDPGKLILSPVWSPDGKMIAYFSRVKDTSASSYMNVVNVENGKTSIVEEVPIVYVFSSELAWSPDSKKIAFNDYKSNEIKVMSLADGSIEDIKTGLKDVNIYQFDWSPDGERFVFGGRKSGGEEFWFLEDFLPLEKINNISK